MKISQILKENKEEFEEKIVLADFTWRGDDAYGLKRAEGSKLKIKSFLHSSQTKLIEEVIKEVEGIKGWGTCLAGCEHLAPCRVCVERQTEERTLQKIIDYLKEGIKI